MTEPQFILFWPAIFAAVVAAFLFGFVWYGPLFGKTWARLMGMDVSKKPESKDMRRALIIQIFGTFLVALAMSQINQMWRPSVWRVGYDSADLIYGFCGGFTAWIGFYVPLQLNKVAWEKRPWSVFFINTGHDFLNLQLISQILAHWRM